MICNTFKHRSILNLSTVAQFQHDYDLIMYYSNTLYAMKHFIIPVKEDITH